MQRPLDTRLEGLSTVEARRRQASCGRNEVTPPRPPGLVRRVAGQLSDPLIIVLLAAMAVTVLLADTTDTIVIGLVIALNTTVGVIQQVRADHAVAALRQLAAPTARVVRDGRLSQLPAAEVVPGDVVRLAGGDIVPADLRLDRADRFSLDEAALTGESVPVPHEAGDDALAGTVVVAGTAQGEVTATGPASALGRIAALVAGQPRRRTPLQRRLVGLGRALGIACVALSVVVLAVGVLRGQPWAEMVLVAVSLTVAAVPESLPAVVTIALALGAYRMARRAAIVRQLPAVETLGSVTLLATDKTGTLTTGTMTCDRVVLPDTVVAVSGNGYAPTGTVSVLHGASRPAQLDRLARDLVLCNDAELRPPEAAGGDWGAVGDPMEAALAAAAGRLGVAVEPVRDRFRRVAEIGFDTATRRMITAHDDPDGGYLLVGKGAPEVLLPPGDPLLDRADRLTRGGYRVLAVGDAHCDTLPGEDRWPGLLAPRGLVALTDPIRPGMPELLDRFHRAGIEVVMVTGDHPATARAVARQVGIADDAVHARSVPEAKMDLIAGWQAAGQIVAMTGDGVNDAPALRRADIGVAMGRGGTEVARQAADLVLADDELATVGVAVEEGRRIYANIRRFLRYALSGGLAEILVMLAGPALGLAVPLLPAQILWVNMLTHGLPGVALGAEPPDRDLLDAPPRPPGEAILGAGLGWRVGLTGTLIALLSLAAGGWGAATGRPWQTLLFLVLGFAQLGVALAVRARPSGRDEDHRALYAAVASSAILQLAAVTVPALRELLGTSPVSGIELVGCLLLGAVPGLALTVAGRLRRARPARAG
ncbi:cation-translocating P-type ATPase [Actinocatenispora thailandica]|uniref:cation-translocating P-type ATPase n=1 Tax=Actinocatenispora thailandica TaxID=227318 RepID=UPI001EF1EFF4|nr:cation-transporting P-type ATPase [Actinocatenispora thailandica]